MKWVESCRVRVSILGTPPYVNNVLYIGTKYKYRWGKCLEVFYVYIDTTCELVRWKEEKDQVNVYACGQLYTQE